MAAAGRLTKLANSCLFEVSRNFEVVGADVRSRIWLLVTNPIAVSSLTHLPSVSCYMNETHSVYYDPSRQSSSPKIEYQQVTHFLEA